MNDDLIIPRIIRDDTGNFANWRPRPFDILQVADYYCFGDGTLANKAWISYLEKKSILVPLRMSRMFVDPFKVYKRLARQHYASAGFNSKLTFTIEIDINRLLSQEQCVKMCHDFGFDTTHPVIQAVCSKETLTDQFVFSCNFCNDDVTLVPMTFELGKPISLTHIYIGGLHDKPVKTLENVEFKFFDYVRQDKIEVFFAKPSNCTWPIFISKLKSFISRMDYCLWKSDVNIDGIGTSVMVLYPRDQTKDFVTAICSEFGISRHAIKFSNYEYGGPMIIDLHCKPERELRRIIMNAVVCFGDAMTSFVILYVLDYLPCMWIYSRLKKMRRLELCFQIIRDVRNKRVYSD